MFLYCFLTSARLDTCLLATGFGISNNLNLLGQLNVFRGILIAKACVPIQVLFAFFLAKKKKKSKKIFSFFIIAKLDKYVPCLELSLGIVNLKDCFCGMFF